MTEWFAFERPWALALGILAAIALTVAAASALRRAGVPRARRMLLLGLRGGALLILVWLLAVPIARTTQDETGEERIALMVDVSGSMALMDEPGSRYARAVEFADELAPRLEAAGWRIDRQVFADGAVSVGPQWRSSADGDRTDLGAAIVDVIAGAAPPLAIVAVTDGVSTESASHRDAVGALVETATPFVGVGVGSDEGVATLTLTHLAGPQRVAAGQRFRLHAEIESTGGLEAPGVELVLTRDGTFVESRSVASLAGGGWTEEFSLAEAADGFYEYSVQLHLPESAPWVPLVTRASHGVRVAQEEDFRILFAQGALTWNFKFIARALRDDPTVRVTALSRTSERSFFRQNVEAPGELSAGFPSSLAELSRYRVVILSELKPADLSPEQQTALARYVGEFGGGLLMIGGSSTFDGSWRESRLEELLPVRFDPRPGVLGLDAPFRLQLTRAAYQHPVFQVDGDAREVETLWNSLPTFTDYGRVHSAKPGAFVWVVHNEDVGPEGQRILMAGQRYGAGLTAIVGVRNLWRWRLAPDSDPEHFDRFWRQLARHLGQLADEVRIERVRQPRAPGETAELVVERTARPRAATEAATEAAESAKSYRVEIEGPGGDRVVDRTIELISGRLAPIEFEVEEAGLHTVRVLDGDGRLAGSRALDVREYNREMEQTARSMDHLDQWASISAGFAQRLEEVDDVDRLTDELASRVAEARVRRERPRPIGWNPWVLGAVLILLCGEWLLRKPWGMS